MPLERYFHVLTAIWAFLSHSRLSRFVMWLSTAASYPFPHRRHCQPTALTDLTLTSSHQNGTYVRCHRVAALPASLTDRPNFLFGRSQQCCSPMWQLDPDGSLAFGLFDLGMREPELGYISLAELSTVRGKLGLPVVRDWPLRSQQVSFCLCRRACARSHIVT
jgi:hypothetical protein